MDRLSGLQPSLILQQLKVCILVLEVNDFTHASETQAPITINAHASALFSGPLYTAPPSPRPILSVQPLPYDLLYVLHPREHRASDITGIGLRCHELHTTLLAPCCCFLTPIMSGVTTH